MEIGIYGLGRMGGNMATRLAQGGHRVVASNRSREPVDEATKHGAVAAYTIEEMVANLRPPRVLWSMVPAGAVTDEALEEFARYATAGDIFVDGGNSNFHESQRRADKYSAQGFRYLDIGVSGGIWGLKVGYCMMVGGPADAVAIVAPLLDTLAPPNHSDIRAGSRPRIQRARHVRREQPQVEVARGNPAGGLGVVARINVVGTDLEWLDAQPTPPQSRDQPDGHGRLADAARNARDQHAFHTT